MREMQAYMAGIPYVEGFKKKLEYTATREGLYEYTMYLTEKRVSENWVTDRLPFGIIEEWGIAEK